MTDRVITITSDVSIALNEIQFVPIRAGGPGGQNVNKVSTAIHLRFDIAHSSLPDDVKTRLLHLDDNRINKRGVIIIKSQQTRSRETNREIAVQRLVEMIRKAAERPKTRHATRPTFSSQIKRLQNKARQGKLKAQRKRIRSPDEY